MAEMWGIKQRQCIRYEKGIKVMPVTYLLRTCKIFGVLDRVIKHRKN